MQAAIERKRRAEKELAAATAAVKSLVEEHSVTQTCILANDILLSVKSGGRYGQKAEELREAVVVLLAFGFTRRQIVTVLRGTFHA